MRKLTILLSLMALLSLAACDIGGSSGGSSNTVTMGSSSFVGSTNISITAGQAVTFDDPSSSGGTHNLVTGMHGQFSAEVGAPSEFATSAGINFSPGDNKTITFPTAGTYNITCTIHSPMQATITVT
jgi:plastocyanin